LFSYTGRRKITWGVQEKLKRGSAKERGDARIFISEIWLFSGGIYVPGYSRYGISAGYAR
jgi:hypothetical protein